LSNCNNYAILGDTGGNTYLNTTGTGSFNFRNNNNSFPDAMLITPSGNLTMAGNLTAAGTVQSSVGVLGQGPVGIQGTTSGASGIGVKGINSGGAVAGYFLSNTVNTTDNTARFQATGISPWASHIHYGATGDIDERDCIILSATTCDLPNRPTQHDESLGKRSPLRQGSRRRFVRRSA
jgi:hypothetical protein